jgi:photosystem II stability/assembly factor-like uncharacterized protein
MKKSKILKILGVGLTLGMVFSLVAGVFPVAAADDDDYNDNEWSLFEYPLAGEDGDWFRQDPDDPIMMIGPMAEATNGDIYVYVWIDEDEDCCHDQGYDTTFGEDKIFKSTDGGRTWAETGYSDPEVITICCPEDGEVTPGPVVDMVCSSEDEDTIFVTDGWYVYMSDDGGDEWEAIGAESLEEEIMGDCDCCITEALEPWNGDYIRPITCLDVGYENDSAFVFVGTVQHYSDCWDEVPYDDDFGGIVSGSVYYISLDAFPSDWTDLQLDCYEDEDDEGPYNVFRLGCQPNFDDEKRIFILASGTGVVDCEEFPDTSGTCQTKILYTEGTPCAWTEFNELFQDCDLDNNFAVGRYVEECFDECFEDDVGRYYGGSRFAWPTDWEDEEVMFIGVIDDGAYIDNDGTTAPYVDCGNPGGDVYRVCDSADGKAIDLNVEGIAAGCRGDASATQILSLDICGDTDEATLVAGAYFDLYVGAGDGPADYEPGGKVYWSEDGGWSWEESDKNPGGEGLCDFGPWPGYVGEELTYTILLDCDEGVLASTSGCDAAVSLACGEELAENFNGISLHALDIDAVIDIDHHPDYLDTGAEDFYMITEDCDPCPCCDFAEGPDGVIRSLFRHDGMYWERVYSGPLSSSEEYGYLGFDWVRVSPDFEAVYLFNDMLEGWRTTDGGCSWTKLTFPCEPRPYVCSVLVIDKDTVVAGGWDSTYDNYQVLYKTTRHGVRPWDEYEMEDPADYWGCAVVDLAIPMDYDDPGWMLAGDDCGRVFISEEGGEDDWELVGDCVTVLGGMDTSVEFDPGWGVTDDPGEWCIYAASGNVIARCIIDPDEDWEDQEWEQLNDTAEGYADDRYWGLEVAGDTALYATATCAEEFAGEDRDVDICGEICVEIPAEKIEWILEGPIPEFISLPLVGYIDIDCIDATDEEVGTFVDEEVVEIISAWLTVTGCYQCAEVAWTDGGSYTVTGIGYTEVDWSNEVTCEVTPGPGVSYYDYGSYGYAYLDDGEYITFSPTGGADGSVDVCVWGSYTYDCTGTCTAVFDPVQLYVSGTVGVRGAYSGAVADLEVYDEPVYFPMGAWAYISETWGDMICPGLYDGVLPWVENCSNLVADVEGAVAGYETLGGVLRTLNPLVDLDEEDVEWERLLEGLEDGFDEADDSCYSLFDLWLTHGSNVLWALDACKDPCTWCMCDYCCESPNIFYYEDLLAEPVIANSPCGDVLLETTDEVTLSWDELDDAEWYEVDLYSYCAECPDTELEVEVDMTEELCIVVEDLEPGAQYFWSVRAHDPILSKWSEECSFLTALEAPVLIAPASGDQDIIRKPTFNWYAVDGADAYEIEVATDENFTSLVASGTAAVNAWVIGVELDYLTAYYWRVRAVSNGIYSDWSTEIFTILEEPAEAPPPVVVEEQAPPEITIEQPQITPMWIYAIIAIGATLAVLVIVLVVRTRRAP